MIAALPTVSLKVKRVISAAGAARFPDVVLGLNGSGNGYGIELSERMVATRREWWLLVCEAEAEDMGTSSRVEVLMEDDRIGNSR